MINKLRKLNLPGFGIINKVLISIARNNKKCSNDPLPISMQFIGYIILTFALCDIIFPASNVWWVMWLFLILLPEILLDHHNNWSEKNNN